MAEEKPSIHIDSDWKKQAQEEKKRLAEQEQRQAKASVAPAGVVAGAASGGKTAPAGRGQPGGGESRQVPSPSMMTLTQTLMTQTLFYLGELGQRGAEPTVNLDMAKHQIDTLGMLEEKTRGNLTPDEQAMLDLTLYETRMRFISVGTQYAQLP